MDRSRPVGSDGWVLWMDGTAVATPLLPDPTGTHFPQP